jgi:hypothetical protein
LSQVNLEDMELENEQLNFGSEVVCFLGPKLTLRGCTVMLGMAARNLIIPQARFVDCIFITKRELRNFRWDTAHLQGCQFKGRFIGNDFGEWPSSPGQGSIEDCDFSGAHLGMTRFLGCDVHTLRFPRWPCFTILDPVRRWRELSALPWPGLISRVTIAGLAESPASTVALTFAAPDLAKRYGTTPEALKAVVEKMDGVFY